jgi:hypothetical protein
VSECVRGWVNERLTGGVGVVVVVVVVFVLIWDAYTAFFCFALLGDIRALIRGCDDCSATLKLCFCVGEISYARTALHRTVLYCTLFTVMHCTVVYGIYCGVLTYRREYCGPCKGNPPPHSHLGHHEVRYSSYRLNASDGRILPLPKGKIFLQLIIKVRHLNVVFIAILKG